GSSVPAATWCLAAPRPPWASTTASSWCRPIVSCSSASARSSDVLRRDAAGAVGRAGQRGVARGGAGRAGARRGRGRRRWDRRGGAARRGRDRGGVGGRGDRLVRAVAGAPPGRARLRARGGGGLAGRA